MKLDIELDYEDYIALLVAVGKATEEADKCAKNGGRFKKYWTERAEQGKRIEQILYAAEQPT